MRAFARLIMVFLGLLFIGAALFLAGVNYNWFPFIRIDLPAWAVENVILAAGSVLLLLALIFLSFGMRSVAKRMPSAVLKDSEYGEVLISITALENMVLKVVQQTKGIKDIGRKVNHKPEGLFVKINVKAMPDISIPEIIGELQSKVKQYVEESTGLTVREVKVLVENIVVDQTASKSK